MASTSKTLLPSMPKAAKWDLGTDALGNVLFNTPVIGVNFFISVSMAHMEAGRDIGIGKMYYVISKLMSTSMNAGTTCSMVFVKEKWSQFDLEEWDSASQKERVERCASDARLELGELVMPVLYTGQAPASNGKRKATLNLAPKGGAGSLETALVLYDGRPHLAWKSQWANLINDKGAVIMGEARHQQFISSARQPTTASVMRMLGEMWDEQPTKLVLYREVFNEIKAGVDTS